MILVDFDDFHGSCNLTDLFRLKDMYPKFKVTLFTIPSQCSIRFLRDVSKLTWVQMAIHGIRHSPLEFKKMSYNRCASILVEFKKGFYVKGFKAPHWQYSRESMAWLRDNDFWVAVHLKTDEHVPVLPQRIRYYNFMESPHDCWHGHMIWDASGNALASNLSHLLEKWDRDADFGFVNDAVVRRGHEGEET